MQYQLTKTQSYNISELQKALTAAGITGGISGLCDKEFIVHSEDAGVDAVVQNHLLTDWVLYKNTQNKRLQIINEISKTDAEMARVGEDLLSVLITKNVIVLTDLPKSAQDKLAERATLRRTLSSI